MANVYENLRKIAEGMVWDREAYIQYMQEKNPGKKIEFHEDHMAALLAAYVLSQAEYGMQKDFKADEFLLHPENYMDLLRDAAGKLNQMLRRKDYDEMKTILTNAAENAEGSEDAYDANKNGVSYLYRNEEGIKLAFLSRLHKEWKNIGLETKVIEENSEYAANFKWSEENIIDDAQDARENRMFSYCMEFGEKAVLRTLIQNATATDEKLNYFSWNFSNHDEFNAVIAKANALKARMNSFGRGNMLDRTLEQQADIDKAAAELIETAKIYLKSKRRVTPTSSTLGWERKSAVAQLLTYAQMQVHGKTVLTENQRNAIKSQVKTEKEARTEAVEIEATRLYNRMRVDGKINDINAYLSNKPTGIDKKRLAEIKKRIFPEYGPDYIDDAVMKRIVEKGNHSATFSKELEDGDALANDNEEVAPQDDFVFSQDNIGIEISMETVNVGKLIQNIEAMLPEDATEDWNARYDLAVRVLSDAVTVKGFSMREMEACINDMMKDNRIIPDIDPNTADLRIAELQEEITKFETLKKDYEKVEQGIFEALLPEQVREQFDTNIVEWLAKVEEDKAAFIKKYGLKAAAEENVDEKCNALRSGKDGSGKSKTIEQSKQDKETADALKGEWEEIKNLEQVYTEIGEWLKTENLTMTEIEHQLNKEKEGFREKFNLDGLTSVHLNDRYNALINIKDSFGNSKSVDQVKKDKETASTFRTEWGNIHKKEEILEQWKKEWLKVKLNDQQKENKKTIEENASLIEEKKTNLKLYREVYVTNMQKELYNCFSHAKASQKYASDMKNAQRGGALKPEYALTMKEYLEKLQQKADAIGTEKPQQNADNTEKMKTDRLEYEAYSVLASYMYSDRVYDAPWKEEKEKAPIGKETGAEVKRSKCGLALVGEINRNYQDLKETVKKEISTDLTNGEAQAHISNLKVGIIAAYDYAKKQFEVREAAYQNGEINQPAGTKAEKEFEKTISTIVKHGSGQSNKYEKVEISGYENLYRVISASAKVNSYRNRVLSMTETNDLLDDTNDMFSENIMKGLEKKSKFDEANVKEYNEIEKRKNALLPNDGRDTVVLN